MKITIDFNNSYTPGKNDIEVECINCKGIEDSGDQLAAIILGVVEFMRRAYDGKYENYVISSMLIKLINDISLIEQGIEI